MMFQSFLVLQLLGIGSFTQVAGHPTNLTELAPRDSYEYNTNPVSDAPILRTEYPPLWFYSDAECKEPPSEPEILAGDTNETKCLKLKDRMSVGIGPDPDRSNAQIEAGCMLLYLNGKCTGEAISIDLPYKDATRCRKFGLKGGDFKSYRVRSAYGCAGWKSEGEYRPTLDEVDFVPPQ